MLVKHKPEEEDKPVAEAFSPHAFLASLTTACGVYQMFDARQKVLYVGKARNLKNRLQSYFRKNLAHARLASLVKQIHHIDVIVTRNENEALLLENQLIKTLQPRYNILLRDDKSFPYIVLTQHAYPRLLTRRGARQGRDQYYGPYTSGLAVRETIKLMQTVFQLRTCQDNFFQHRSRPCLLYAIKKCSAPCVNHISAADYAERVKDAQLFLQGKNQQVIERLMTKMETAAAQRDYETAARWRDQIARLRHMLQQQAVTTAHGDSDVFVVVSQAEFTVTAVLSVREGRVMANQVFYPRLPAAYAADEILAAFIPQYYLTNTIPDEIVVAQPVAEQQWLSGALTQLRGKKVRIIRGTQGDKQAWIQLAQRSARQALSSKIASRSHYQQRLHALQTALHLSHLPARMECFDISHSAGEATVASCVVFDENGAAKNAYRRFNIHDITAGDDYAAIAQAIQRRYSKIRQGEEKLPDILFIDGGKGQLQSAKNVLEALAVTPPCVVAIAKGVERKPGKEQLFILGQSMPLILTPDSPALHLIQQIRDEAHRFALHGHQRKRASQRRVSLLEQIPGIGKRRRQALLYHLGGWQEVRRATIEELQRVPGISPLLAQRIYEFCNRYT